MLNNKMTTFTSIPESQRPVISVNVKHKIAKINDNVYGGFTE
jgi:alpha-N-arabinofuranosidase